MPTPSTYPRTRTATPLARVARTEARRLLATWLTVTAVAFVPLHLVGLDHRTLAALAVEGGVETLLYARPVADVRVRLQVASLVGLAATLAVGARLAADHDRVELAAGRGPLALAAIAAPVGSVAGVAAVPVAVRALAAAGVPAPLVDPYWLGEFTLGVAVAGTVALAGPPAVVGAARAGVVDRLSSPRQRGLAALAVVSVAAVYSPSDTASFVAVAAPSFAGLAAGVAYLEFRG